MGLRRRPVSMRFHRREFRIYFLVRNVLPWHSDGAFTVTNLASKVLVHARRALIEVEPA